MGRVLGGIRLAGVLLSASVLPHSFLSASKIFSDGRNKDIPIDQLCDTVHVVVGSLQFQLTTKNEIGNPFRGSLSHFFVEAVFICRCVPVHPSGWPSRSAWCLLHDAVLRRQALHAGGRNSAA